MSESKEFRWVGKRLPRPDGPDRATGATRFMTDLQFPNALVGRVLRSRHPHALIRRIDTTWARALAGVACVLTAEDVPWLNRFGILIQDQPVLAEDRVRMTGDAVALVAAESEEIAEQALGLIEVEYEPLEPVTDPVEALEPDAPQVHAGGNLLQETHLSRGDVTRAFAEAAVVVEGRFITPRQMHAYLETEGGWAKLEEDGTLTICCPGQAAYRDRMQVARILGWNPNRIRIISSPVGGAFGGKDELTVQHYLALLALNTGGRPVKIHYSREESVVAGIKRNPFRIEARLAVSADGAFTGLEARLWADKGAYASLGPAILNLAVEHMGGPYKIPNVDLLGRMAYTNNGTNGAFRGFGVPQVCFALESLVDMAAGRLGLDPIAIRKQNVVRRGDVEANGTRVESSVAVWECLDAVERSETWGEREAWIASAPPGKLRGAGLACAVHGVGLGKGVADFAQAAIELHEDGRFRVLIAPQEIGQGSSTAFLLMAAEALGCDPGDISLIQGDTGIVPDGGTVTASRATYAGGQAILAAARNMVSLMKQGASALFDVADDQVVLGAGGASVAARPERRCTYAEIYGRIAPSGRPLRAEGHFSLPQADEPLEGVFGSPHRVCGYAAQGVLLEVDEWTGETRVARVVSAVDAGTVINPLGLEGQSEGGVVMGMGFALMEDSVMAGGIHRNKNLTTYMLPTAVEAPKIETIAVQSHEETGPFGAKGIGEVVMVPVVAAVPNAIAQASGARLFQLPATPERVWRAMQGVEEQGSGVTLAPAEREEGMAE